MPARIVVVHNDPKFTERTVAALVAAGHDARAFTDTMSALKALERAQRVEVLVTASSFRRASRTVSRSLNGETQKAGHEGSVCRPA